MKSLLFSTGMALAVILLLIPFIYADCGDDREYNVGYHYVPIPAFKDSDYISMLDNKNPEIQYNAICYLHENISRESPLDVDSLRGTKPYDSALTIYNKIFPLMNAENTWLSSAAIRYCAMVDHNRKKFLFDVLSNNSRSLNIQLEIVNSCIGDSVYYEDLQLSKYNFLMQQPSWLLQNSAYRLLYEMEHLPSGSLISDYSKTNEREKKLLILDLLTHHITDTVFTFLSDEYASTRDRDIRELIFVSFRGMKNEDSAYQWYSNHMDEVMRYMELFVYSIFSSNKNLSERLVIKSLEKGWSPGSITEDNKPVLYSILLENKTREITVDSVKNVILPRVKRIEDALLRNEHLAKEWLAFQDAEKEYSLPKELISKHQSLAEEYIQQTKALFIKYGIDTSNLASFLEESRTRSRILYQEKYKK